MMYNIQHKHIFSMASTPSDFDETLADRFRVMTEKELFKQYITNLNKMNDDLVFDGNKCQTKLVCIAQIELRVGI